MTSSTQVATPDPSRPTPGRLGRISTCHGRNRKSCFQCLCLCAVPAAPLFPESPSLPLSWATPVAADLFGEQVDVLAREMEGVTTLPLGVQGQLFPHEHVVLQSVGDAPRWRKWDLHLHQLHRDSPRAG